MAAQVPVGKRFFVKVGTFARSRGSSANSSRSSTADAPEKFSWWVRFGYAGRGLLYSVVVVGVMMFGAFSLIVARYLIVARVERQDLKPAFG
jgi:hypothetical protein